MKRGPLRDAVTAYMKAHYGLARIRARQSTLSRYRSLLEQGGTAGEVAALLVADADRLDERDRAWRPRFAAFVRAYDDKVMPYRDWFEDAVGLFDERGAQAGESEELGQIAGDLAALDAADAARGAIPVASAVSFRQAAARAEQTRFRVTTSPLWEDFDYAVRNPRVCTGIGVRLSCY